jgi:hypothetical protein
MDQNQGIDSERFHIKSLRLWGFFNFFFVAELTVNPYTLTIESRRFGFLKKYLQFDLQRIHRITPYLINGYAVLKLEAERGEIRVAKKNGQEELPYAYIGIWLPYIFYRDEAIAFVDSLRAAIVKRELINRNYQRFNGN